MSRLNDLIRQVGLKDEALAVDLQREVAALADRRSFGLNFERHVPEAVELPGRPVRRGDKVRILPPRGETPTKADEKLWRVASVHRASAVATLEPLNPVAAPKDSVVEPVETTKVSLDDLVVVAEFRDPIYPGLVSTGKIERGGDKPFHTVINAENYHALQALLFTHRGKVDCIYIDPPYNTGNEGWIYNDKYVAGDDLYKHSKWLAFMERRLLLAKDLLKPTGVIIVAIGDEEHHRLRLLMDQVFHESNFLADLVWQGRVKNDRRFTGGGADFMLCYAKQETALVEADVRWKEPSPGALDLLGIAHQAYEGAVESGAERLKAAEAATKKLRAWIKQNRHQYAGGLLAYQTVDENGRVYQPGPLDSPNPRPNLTYEVLHPVTGKPVPTPAKGWRVSQAVMEEMREAGRIVWGPDHTTGIRRKLVLDYGSKSVPSPTFTADRDTATKHLKEILGDIRFPNPKSHEVLLRWLDIVAPHDGVVVDFFGGSGSTCEAVMRLNAKDGGTRKCILITNNEVSAKDAKALTTAGHRDGDPEWEAKGVHDYVAKPRLTTIATGERPDGSTYEDTVNANVEFFDLTYEAPLRVASHRDFERIAPLLWLRAGSRGRRIDDVRNGWDVAEAYGVLADLDQVEPFLKGVAAQDGVGIVFIVTDEDRLFESVVRELPEHVEPVRLYEAYLRNFEIESGRGLR